MLPDKNSYDEMVKKASKPSNKKKDCCAAFLVGGLICTIGQLIFEGLKNLGVKEDTVRSAVPMILIFFAAVLTGIGVFDKIAKFAGAGTLVPITGFSNAVVSPAIEYKNEGHILGIGTKIFSVAGPVILFGTYASVVYGLIYYVFMCLKG